MAGGQEVGKAKPDAGWLIDQQVTFIYTRDLAAGSSFLSDKLGLERVLDQFGICHIYRVTGTSFLGVCVNREPPSDPGVTCTFVARDVDAAYKVLSGRGVVFDGPPRLSKKIQRLRDLLRRDRELPFRTAGIQGPGLATTLSARPISVGACRFEIGTEQMLLLDLDRCAHLIAKNSDNLLRHENGGNPDSSRNRARHGA